MLCGSNRRPVTEDVRRREVMDRPVHPWYRKPDTTEPDHIVDRPRRIEDAKLVRPLFEFGMTVDGSSTHLGRFVPGGGELDDVP